MGARTGRKTPANPKIRQRVLQVARENPHLSNPEIAERFPGISPRQVQYWVSQDRKQTAKAAGGQHGQ